MRTLKFRVWDEEKKKYCTEYDAMTLKHDGEFCIERGWCIISGGFEVEQYTGLKDKNGTEIYEGDIVKIYRGRKLDGVFLVQFDEPNGEYAWCKNEDIDSARYGGFPYWAKYLVIGNIHENSESLGGEE